MKTKIKRFDKTLPRPEYKTSGAVGIDLYLRFDEKIKPGEIKLLPANLAVAVPSGHFLLINSRSSTIGKYGLLVIPGILDRDYCGDEDEILISVINLSKKAAAITRGTRIAQGVFIKISRPDIHEVKKMKSKSRGGFGTTGN